MKKIYTLLCIAATMLAACAKENIAESGEATPQDEEVKYIDVTFGAEFPVPAELQDNAKTMLNNDLSVSWCEGDKIAVNTNGTVSGKTSLYLTTFDGTVNKEDSHRATFTGTINDNATSFIAVYPAANVKLGSDLDWGITSDGTVYSVLPTSQTAVKGSFTNGCAISYVIGSVSNKKIQDNIEFNNLCALLEFTMPDYVIGATSVKIQSNDGIKMSGGCVIDRFHFEFRSFGPSDKKDDTYDYVTVTSPNTADKFYAVIFPGNYASGFNITVTTADGQTYSLNVPKPLNAQANHIYNLGVLGVVLDEGKVSANVDIEQNLSSGSIATLNMTVSDALKDMVTKWIVELCDKNGVVIRKSEITDGNLSNIKMGVIEGHTLIPAGDYTIKVSYNMPTGSTRKISTDFPATAPQFNVTVTDLEAESNLAYSGGVLTGTDIKVTSFTVDVLPEIAAKIEWVNFNLKDANETLYRTSTKLNEVMAVENSLPYLPNGTYKLTAGFRLTELGGTGIAETAPFDVTVSHTPTFGVKLTSAKTSYDYYKAGEIDTANGCKNMGIYELAANVTGISDAVSTQMAGKFTYEWFLGGNSIGKTENADADVYEIDKNTENEVKVAFGSKNVNCKATFEGGNATSGNFAVNITGLPIYISSAKLDDLKSSGWSTQGQVKTYDNYLCTFYRTYLGPEQGAMVTPEFYLPASTNVSCYVKHMNYAAGVGKNQRAYIGPVSTASSSTTSYYLDCEYTAGSKTHNGTLEFSLSQSLPYIYFGVSGDYNKVPSVTTYYLIDINITYR